MPPRLEAPQPAARVVGSKQEGINLRISTRLAPIELVESASEEAVRLGDLWQSQTTVLIFLRHFG